MTFPYRLSSPGGGPIGFQRIAFGLAELGAEVQALVVDRPGAGEPVAVKIPLDVQRIPPSRFHYLLDGIAVASHLRRSDRGSLQWVVGWSTEAAWARRAADRVGARVGFILAASYRSWADRKTTFPALKRYADRYFRMAPLQDADVIFAISQFTANEAVDVLGIDPRRIVVSHWGVDHSYFDVERPPLRRGPLQILFYGALAPLKGVFDAIQACGLAAREGLDFQLRLAGWGDVEAVQRAAVAARITDRVTYLGTLSHRSLQHELALASVALLPSHSESFGLAIAEAQAAGVPVVSYSAGAVPEVVQDDITGLLVPLGRTDLLASALTALSDEGRRRRMGMAARKHVRQRFTWKRTAATMMAAMDLRAKAPTYG